MAFACSDPASSSDDLGASGGTASGGAASGGSAPTGGVRTSTGGASTGGVSTGGAATGGVPNGGVSTGGAATGGVSTGGASTGGKSGSGGAATGGKSGSGGAATGGVATGGKSGSGGQSTGGASGGSAPTGGKAGNSPAIGPGPCGCETPAGEFGTVDATIVVAPGETYDGACKIFRANPSTLGAGNQDEGQKPVFRVEDGATLKNVVLGTSAADGIHLHGDVTLENIHWLDIGEDAMTVKESGTVRLNCGSATKASDKIFQVNAAADIYITNFTASDGGKFMRQNGDTTFKMTLTIDHCDISDLDEVIYRTDSTTSHVTLTNTRYSRLGDGLFMFGSQVVNGNSAQSTVSNNQQY